MIKVYLKEDRREIYERLESSIREAWHNGNNIEEIRVHYKQYSYLTASCPQEMLQMTMDKEENRVLLFMGVPLERGYDFDDDVEYKLVYKN